MAHNTIKRQCETCGKDFLTNNAKIRDGCGRFCSRQCYHSNRKTSYVDLICATCLQPYRLELGQYNSRIKQGHPVRYCSIQCAHQSPDFARSISHSLKNSNAFKIARIRAAQKAAITRGKPENQERARRLMAEQMADPEKRARWENGIKRRSSNPKWRDAPWHLRGEANPQFTGGRRERNTEMGRYAYKQWRTEVFHRDGYTCQKCYTKGRRLNAHHIKPWAEYPDLRYDISNGITLCEHCHDLEHGKVRKPKTYKCRVCGKSKKSGYHPRCLECGRKHLPLPE